MDIQDEQLQQLYKSYCIENKINTKDINEYSSQNNRNKQTFSMWLAKKEIIGPQYVQHDPKLQNIDGYTVASLLESKQIQVPKNQLYNPKIILKDLRTTAMLIALQGKIPQQYWEHDPNLTDKYNYTVAHYLAENGIVPPKQWQIEPQKRQLTGMTVAMLLAKNKVKIPVQYYHNPYLKSNFNKTVSDYLIQSKMFVPSELTVDKHILHSNELALKQISYKIIPNIIDPYISDDNNNTAAMLLAMQKIIAPQCLEHDPILENIQGQTVAVLLEINKIEVPKQWIYSSQYRLKQFQTTAMKIATYGIIPSQKWYHNKYMRDANNMTVSDILKSKNLYVPIQWQCDSVQYVDDQFNTNAMIQAFNHQIPDKNLYHDPNIINIQGQSVPIILLQQDIVPPQEWLQNIDYNDDLGKEIKQQMLQLGHIYYDNQFIKLNQQNALKYIKVSEDDKICFMCQTQQRQQIINSKCKHIICLQCFYKLLQEADKKQFYCPICKQVDWIDLKYQEKQEFTLIQYINIISILFIGLFIIKVFIL